MLAPQIMSTAIFSEALVALQNNIQELDLTPEQRQHLKSLLEQVKTKPMSEVAALLAQLPSAAQFVETYIEFEEYKSYTPPILGLEQVDPPGPLRVCPIDPKHYSQYQHSQGQVLYCPQHDVELIPAE